MHTNFYENWGKPISQDAMERRASGRRKQLARRRRKVIARMNKLFNLRQRHHNLTQTQLAEILGVHQSTISRDLRLDHKFSITAHMENGHWTISQPTDYERMKLKERAKSPPTLTVSMG